MVDLKTNTTKNPLPYAIVIAALIVAGAVIFAGVYLQKEGGGGSGGSGLGEVLEEAGGPAAVVGGEPSEPIEEETPQYDTATLEKFAACLKDKGMKFYGASWCGWCQKQKEVFGEVKGTLPYIECVDEQTKEMTVQCREAGIESFPTWILQDGTKSPGFKPLEDLVKLSGCEL